MKILHKSKKAVPPPTQVAELITKLINTSTSELLDVLSQIDSWKWPRSDLNAWIKVLNKFDGILEEIINEYDLDKLQLNPFTPTSKRLIAEILRFERLLLENSTNRKTFSSYDRLNSLLFTSDLDILVLALNLLLRPSQQYSAQPSVSHALSISTTRLQSLAKKWPHLREYGIGLVDLSCGEGNAELEALPAEAREVNFTFYRTTEGTGAGEKKAEDSVEPTSQERSVPGAVTVHIGEATVLAQPVMNVLADAIDAYSIPDSEKFEVLCRIRTAASLVKDRTADREKLVIIRLLAIAIYGHTHPESQATSNLFLYEPDLIVHIAELLQIDHGIPVQVQTAAIAALDALARYRSRIQEVLTAVNAGVNHGILMALVRKTVGDVANEESRLPHTFIEALLSFVTFIASHASGGNMVIGAGLIPLLIQMIDNKSPLRLQAVSKTMQLVDNVLYSFTNAFHLFCGARGVDVLVERIEHEVDLDIKEKGDSISSPEINGTSGELPIARVAVLKHILRSMHRMMQSSGTTEGLRGLIDMSLLRSVKKIIEYRGLFGSSILPFAINIMATFVHNEPTSLTIIQEAGLPKTFYEAIEAGIEPSIEVIQAIPNAIGALCLNESGQAQLANRPSIIPAIFTIFTSQRHLKVLIEKENAVLIGTAIDELIRHHPTLKSAVFEALKSTMSNIENLGLSYRIPKDILQWYQLIPVPVLAADVDVTMEEADSEALVRPGTVAAEEPLLGETDSEYEDAVKAHDNMVVSFIDILGRFLEGLFQHTPHCKDFITETDGLSHLGRFTALPCLPFDFANSVASDSMVQVMRTMTEVATSETLLHLATLVKDSLAETHGFWENVTEPSKLLPLIDITDGECELANERFRCLVTLHIRITLLSDVFATAGYAHGRGAIGLLQTFMNNTSPLVVADLGSLHRASIWENIALNAGLTLRGINLQTSPSSSPLEGSPKRSDVDLPDENPFAASGLSATNGVQAEDGTNPMLVNGMDRSSHNDPRNNNASALKHITHGLPNALAPFFQAMVKMFHARRNPDAAQKKQMAESSKIVADIMLKHLSVEGHHDTASLFTYYSVILGLLALLLYDDRTSSSTLHTVQLAAFYRADGFPALFNVCGAFMSKIEVIVNIGEGDRTDVQRKDLLHAYGGLKVALSLLHPIISSRPLLDSGQTFLLVSRDKKDTDPDYFEPHNFLVRLRTAALPTVRRLWESSWLVQAPLGVIRAVVRTVLELANGENEETKVDPNADVASAPAGVPRPSGLDQARVHILTDMGFPRSAAERALTRTHNNVNAATEYLLSHPFSLISDPEAEQIEEPIEEDTNIDEVPTDPSAEANIPLSPHAASPSLDSTVSIKGSDGWRKSLNEAREPLVASISRQSLLLIDEHTQLLFDLHVAFTKANNTHQTRAVQDLVDDVKAFSLSPDNAHEQPLANRCRLLALVLCEAPASLEMESRNTLLDQLLALLLPSIDLKHPPRWLASHLLVTEALFTLAEEPRTITLPKEADAIVAEAIPVGPKHLEARGVIFDFCLRLLEVDDLASDELLSALRLLVLFTRDKDMASQFVNREGLDLLFKRIRASPVTGGSSYIATILRHIVEDSTTVQHIMKQAIRRYFAQPRTRVVEIATYVRNCSAMALRDTALFIETTSSLCQLGQPFTASPNISLKVASPNLEDKAEAVDSRKSPEMQVDNPSSHSAAQPRKVVEALIHLLINELMATLKTINDQPPPPPARVGTLSSASDVALATSEILADPVVHPESTENVEEPINIYDKYQYLCFLMQCLTELLFSYDTCKLAFLSFSPKKRSQTPAKEPMNRFRTVTLHFLLNELITFGTINPQPDARARNRITLCNWAMSVVVALCVDTSSTHEVKDVSSDLVSVRKFVLETLSRAIKELSPSESMEARYGRLLALADLCHRLLTVRFNTASRDRKHLDEVPTHLAKVMLEKNFVATLTTALSEVDLNYPNVRNLVTSILRPLEHLTKIAIKMSRSSSKSKEESGAPRSASQSSFASGEDDDLDDAGREETPDLYRNSALGMYAGEMDDGHYPEDEEMDDEDEDEDEDVEMDFGEETGSEDTSNTEDEADEDDLENVTHNPSEVWDEGEEEEEEGLVENHDSHDDDDDDDDEGDDDEGEADEEADEEMMWEDIRGEANGLETSRDDLDEEEEHGVPIQIIHHEEEEPDMGSDEEEFVMENGVFSGEGIFNFGGGLVTTGGGRDGAGLFVSRRRATGDDHVQVFGRSRNAPSAPPESTTHPLLLDSSSGNRASVNQSRGSRQTQRIVAGGSNDFIQSIDDILGGGSMHVLQHLGVVSRGRGGGPEAFRFDVPAGALVNLDRGYVPSRRVNQGLFSAAIRVERAPRPPGQRQGREFDPLLTLQRWAEEMKILHGDFVTERIGKLINHVTLALLPAAVEAAKQAKLREEVEEADRRQQEQMKLEVKAAEEKYRVPETEQPVVESPSSTADAIPAAASSGEASTSPPMPADERQGEQDQVMEMASPVDIDADTEMADISGNQSLVSPPTEVEPSMDPHTEAPAESSSAATTTSERVTVIIHGSAVDITDTGIDPTFLEALPDDMREEVLNQHVRDQRAARVERPPDSQISSEFLEALPPEIRAEIIQQEAIERARRRAEDAPSGATVATPADIDPASFIASLDPTLRQAVLMDQDDGFIQTLPSHMIAEAGAYRDGLAPRQRLATRGAPSRAMPPGIPHARKFSPLHDAIQLLDKAGIAVLVRLLFFPQVFKKTLLFKALVHLCENAKTRTELFNLLLNILQDGTGDLAAVDKSFSQLSVKGSKPQTQKSAGKQKAGSEYLAGFPLPASHVEAVPDLIAQRCLEALSYIVSANDLSSLFFLTEHELPFGLRKAATKKGKGREKQIPQTHYPIVLLLGLLDRQSLLRTPAIMEAVVSLLATVTRPLTSLKDREKTDKVPEPEITTSAITAVSDRAPPTDGSSTNVQVDSTTRPSEPSTNESTSLNASGSPVPAASVENPQKLSIEAVEEKILLANPPQVPHAVLRLIVNILTIGECSGRTFQQSLSLIQHLSYIPDARDVIAHELKSKAQEFGQTLDTDLEELAGALQEAENDVTIGSVAAKFSPASSTQAKLLRVLKTIDYMYTPRTPPPTMANNDVEKVQSIYESFRFTPLWRRLGDCLSVIEKKPDTENIATVLLPLIEALMVVCKYVGSKAQLGTVSRALHASASPRSPATPRESMEDLFISFTDSHRKVLNLMVRNNPSLMSGSFSLLVNNPRVLDFDNKRNYFNQQLHRRPHAREHHGTLQLNVRRARVFEDSFQYLQRKTGDQIKHGKLSVRFYDEEGVDAGGVTREWFQILARQMFDPNNALFQPCAADKLTYQPNKNSWVNPEHLSFFKFVGRVIGKAIYDGRLLDAYFARSLYRQLLGKPVDYKDVEWVDPEYYKSLCWILENDPTVLDLNFSVEADAFGVNQIIPLKEGGESISVTQENKREFVQHSAQYRLYSSIKDQIESLSTGFYEIIPKDLITIFNEQELELLISGTPDIDVDEWRAATEYNGYTSSDPNIVWWWRALKSFNRDERAKVLSFATGTSRVPLSGFVDLQGVQGVQRFSIHRAYGESDRLPQAHTCFNQIDLPQYSSYEMLRQQLLMAINEGGEGFAFS